MEKYFTIKLGIKKRSKKAGQNVWEQKKFKRDRKVEK